MRTTHVGMGLAVVLVGLLAMGGCKRKQAPLDVVMATVASPAGGRTSAAPMIVADWKAGKVKLDDAITLAFDSLDSLKAGKPTGTCKVVPTSKVATEFAGAVLDATRLLDGQLPIGPENEIFWMRVGGLAFAAAEEARAAGRGPEALDLVFAGNKRWQNDAYWHMHPTHDGLASWLLAESGNRPEAVARLRQRADLNGFAAETYRTLTGEDLK